MNNRRLLIGLLFSATMSSQLCAAATAERMVTLEELYEIAETSALRLRPTTADEDAARRALNVARDNRLPDIGVTASVGYIGDGFTTDRGFGDYQRAPIPHLSNGLSLNVSQPVYAGGAITAQIDMARLGAEAAHLSTELERDNLRMSLTEWYLNLYKYSNLRTVVENNIDRARKVLAEMQARYEQGVALRNDITRYELLVADLELQLTKINNLLDVINHELVTVAGLPEGTIVVPDNSIIERLPSAAANEAWWQQEAADNAPSLRLARTQVDISRASERLAHSERLPHINLQAGWTIDGPILVEVPPINRNLSYWFVGVGISYNISSIYKGNRKVARSKAATRAAIDRSEVADQNVSLNVRADHIRYLEAFEELRTQQKSVELAQRNYDTTFRRYSEGMALITDMLDASNSQLDAEQRLINARINIIYYYYKLLYTSGKI